MGKAEKTVAGRKAEAKATTAKEVKETKETKAPPAKPKAVAKDAPKNNGKKETNQAPAESSPGFLSQFRPKPRPIFFLLFCIMCTAICAVYDPCELKGKRRDCGFSGITPMTCRTSACFLKGGGSIGKKTIKVKRKSGQKLGLVLAKTDSAYMVIEEVKEGAVEAYNKALPADHEDIIRVGDRVLQLDKVSGAELMKAVDKSTMATVEIALKRNRVPSFLMFLESQEQPNAIEKFLTSSGGTYFTACWLNLMKIGGAAWLISGYPLASLPAYMTISAGVSFYLARCCHNDNVPSGEPHCFKGRREPIMDVMQQALQHTKKLAEKIQANPRSYFDWAFKM